MFFWSSVCMGTAVLVFYFFEVSAPFMTILTGVFLLDLILVLEDCGFRRGRMGCDVELGGVEQYNGVAFVASIWLDIAGSISPNSIKM